MEKRDAGSTLTQQHGQNGHYQGQKKDQKDQSNQRPWRSGKLFLKMTLDLSTFEAAHVLPVFHMALL
ncbi:MAG TPA: hypothetical protein VEV41_21295 [Terriglobales bacterium]|nr:hypothetical protein [Terriglobales bacterium]